MAAVNAVLLAVVDDPRAGRTLAAAVPLCAGQLVIVIDCGKFWVRFSPREWGFYLAIYASNRTLLGHQIPPALVNSNQLL